MPRISHVPDPPAQSAGIVMELIRRAGLDPRKFGNHPEIKFQWQRLIDEEITDDEFVAECTKIGQRLA